MLYAYVVRNFVLNVENNLTNLVVVFKLNLGQKLQKDKVLMKHGLKKIPRSVQLVNWLLKGLLDVIS